MLYPCFPLRKGLSFYFYVESSSSIFMHRLREHSCHSEYNVHSPKIIIDWFMIMVLLVLKLFVSSHPFELWRCPMHLCFAIPWGTSWIPLCYIFSILKINKYFLMHYYSWSFVYVTFYVVTLLLSSIVRIISLMSMFRVLWSQLARFYIDLIKIVLAACHLKNYFLLSLTYSRDEQELSLGMLDTLQTYL
jgi:hypothetical protein